MERSKDFGGIKMRYLPFLLFLHNLCFAGDPDSGKNISYKGFLSVGYNYRFLKSEQTYYGKYTSFNGYMLSLSNGIMIKDKLFLGLKTDVEKINETYFFPIDIEICPKISKRNNPLYLCFSTGYGYGKTKEKQYALNYYYPTDLKFHYSVGIIYEYTGIKKIHPFGKLTFNQQFFHTYEYYSKAYPIFIKEDIRFVYYNIGLNLGISF